MWTSARADGRRADVFTRQASESVTGDPSLARKPECAESSRVALMFLSEAPDFGADRCKGTILVLLLAEGIGIRSVGCIHRFLQQVRKVMIEARPGRAWLRHDMGCNVPRVFGAKSRIEIVGAVGHIEVDEVGDGDKPCHSRTVIEAVRAP